MRRSTHKWRRSTHALGKATVDRGSCACSTRTVLPSAMSGCGKVCCVRRCGRSTVNRYRVTTDSAHTKPIAANVLNRCFAGWQINRAWVADLTYIRTDEGWLYLACILDLGSRRVVGWSMSARMKAHLVCDALKMAYWRRKPPPGLIMHSDRGVQYAADEHRKLIAQYGMVQSMSRKGNCWDTQSRMALNVRPNLTRAGIGDAALALTCRLGPGVPRASPGPLPVT